MILKDVLQRWDLYISLLKNIKMKLAENRNTLNDPTDVLRLMALRALEKSSR